MKSLIRLFLACLLLAPLGAAAQDANEPPKHEFRGAWIATVIRLDWPHNNGTAAQKAELINELDRLKAAGINAVLFQVRSEADAMYASDIEPWSYWLTGSQGTPPSPFYDPLAFAIEEAHKRGMELHAWFNPYRVQRNVGNYSRDPKHISVRHPEWTFQTGNIQVLDPGLPQVRDFVTSIIMDVARRYDIDGVHFDDYFYPYPPNQISNQDDATFAAHSRGFTDRGDWRRDNVNLLIAQIHDSLEAVRPDVKFGMSPFGIWRNGVPSGISGLDAYGTIYADAIAWLKAKTVDYLTPQLYWSFGGGQDYGRLATWWADQVGDVHFYPGHGLYRSDNATFSNTLFSTNEIPRQVRYNRTNPKIQGSIFFRSNNITTHKSKGFADSLKQNLYRYPALTPPMAWKSQAAPPAPPSLTHEWTGPDEVTLRWTAPPAEAGKADVARYAVYRIRGGAPPDLEGGLKDARNLLAVTGETSIKDKPGISPSLYFYAVRAVSDNSIESSPSEVVHLYGRAVAVETEHPEGFALAQNYPNPFNPTTTIAYRLDRQAVVSVRVFNMLGQTVATLVDRQAQTPGAYEVQWEATGADGHALPSGAYLYQLDAGGQRLSRIMLLVR